MTPVCPSPLESRRIDLAIESGYPSFIRTLDAILTELMVEEIVVATEIHAHNQTVFDQMMGLFENHSMAPKVTEISHEEFKKQTCDSQAVVRTGECTPYANVILKSGVVF